MSDWNDPLDFSPFGDILFEVTYAKDGRKAGARRWALHLIEQAILKAQIEELEMVPTKGTRKHKQKRLQELRNMLS